MNAPSLQSSPLMRAIALFLLSFAIGVPAASSADLPELEKLRASYKAAVARGTKSILQSHITTLEKLRDIYARGGNPQGAAKVQADIDRANVAMSTGEFLPASVDAEVNNARAPELDKLRTQHFAEIERALKPYRETFLRELEKLRDNYTRAANLGAATVLQEEIEAVKSEEPSGKPTGVGDEKFFVGKSWYSTIGAKYYFKGDGTGIRDHANVKVPFTWRKLPDGLVEVSGRKVLAADGPMITWYFQFTNKKNALFGISKTSMPDTLTAR